MCFYVLMRHPVARLTQCGPSSLPQSRVTASVPENLSLFLDPAPKTEEGPVKKLSKDSILSLYGSTPSLHASSMATHGQHQGSSPLSYLHAKWLILFNWFFFKQGCTLIKWAT